MDICMHAYMHACMHVATQGAYRVNPLYLFIILILHENIVLRSTASNSFHPAKHKSSITVVRNKHQSMYDYGVIRFTLRI